MKGCIRKEENTLYKEWKIQIPQLTGRERRKAYIYVPDDSFADDNRRYPVLYMFDGQNLFKDTDASYGKSWGILDYVTKHNVPIIIAAIECNHHKESDKCGGRLSEYSPFSFSDPYFGDITGRGYITMDYIVNEFKPYIDSHYPTMPEREYTYISGSSMGGLMTIFALLQYNEVFSRGAALSPSVNFSPKSIKELIKESNIGETVLYMDMGSEEIRSQRSKKLYGDMTALLMRKGIYVESRIIPGGIHTESSWERQIPFFMNTIRYEWKEEEPEEFEEEENEE